MPKKSLVRIEEGITASTAAYGCAALLDAGLEEQLGPATPEEEGLGPGGGLAVRVARRMEMARLQLEAAKEALERIRDELHRWRQRRDRASDKLYEVAKQLRGLSRGLFDGDEGDTFLGLRGTLPREAKELHAIFGPTVRRIGDAEWPMPEKTTKAIKIDREKLVESLMELHREVGECLQAIRTGETREAVAQAAKKRAADAHAAFVDKGSRFLEISLELAGLDDLAATVRPGVGRVGRPPKKKKLAAPASLPGGQKTLPQSTGGPRAGELPAASAVETADESEARD